MTPASVASLEALVTRFSMTWRICAALARTLGRLAGRSSFSSAPREIEILRSSNDLGHQAGKSHRSEYGALMPRIGHQLAHDLRSANGYGANFLRAFPQGRFRDGSRQVALQSRPGCCPACY